MKIKPFTKRLQSLNDLIDIQCSDGNWNYDPYMHGMANGMLLSLSVIKDQEPTFMQAPKRWLKDTAAQITRTPRSFDFTPGTSELYDNGSMWTGAPSAQQQQSTQSNPWTNSIPTGLGKQLTEEQLFQQLRRMKNLSRDELQALRQKYDRHTIIAPIVQALLSDDEIKQIVGKHQDANRYR